MASSARLVDPETAGLTALISLQPASVLRLLATLRYLAAALLATALVLMSVFGLTTGIAVWALPLLLLVFNQRLPRAVADDHDRRANRALVGHLVFDTSVLFAFFWAIGGATNPFVSLFLLPVAFAGAALDIRGALTVTGVCVAGYTALLWRYLSHLGHPMAVIGFERHVIGMWAMFVLAAGVLLVFLMALAARVRASERELAAQRERLMRDDAVVSVATVAAGAAHALNTPLSTILIAAESLQDEPGLSPDVREDIATIHSQAEQAARELRALVAARDPRAQDTTTAAVFFDTLVARWRARRPEIELDLADWQAVTEQPVRNDPALAQALGNLLDNAADAALAAGHPHLALARHERGAHWVIYIDDPGHPDIERLQRAATASTKPGGLGLGLTLARASLARIGAELSFAASAAGGTRTCIVFNKNGLFPLEHD